MAKRPDHRAILSASSDTIHEVTDVSGVSIFKLAGWVRSGICQAACGPLGLMVDISDQSAKTARLEGLGEISGSMCNRSCNLRDVTPPDDTRNRSKWGRHK